MSHILTISIVTYNHEGIIREVLESLIMNLPRGLQSSIFLVDNQSTDRTSEILREYSILYDHVKFFQNYKNSGYGAGHNFVIEKIKSKYHVIFNPDILINDNIFTPLIRYMDLNPDVGIVCPKFLYRNGKLQPLNHRHPTIYDLFLRRFIPKILKPIFKRRLAYYEMQDVGYENICDVPFVSGAFMLCRTDVLKEIGGFDKRYFLYFEDADLSREFQRHGYRTVFFPTVSVIHIWERAAHKSWKIAAIFVVSAMRYFNKWGYKLF